MHTPIFAVPHDAHDHLDTPEARKSLRAQAAFFFRHASPALLLANFAAIAVARVALGAAFTIADVGVVLAVVVWWPFQEWLFHNVLLHFRPRRILGITIDPLAARAHRAHHRRPWVVETTLLPTILVVGLIPTHLALWWLIAPSWAIALSGGAAYALMAVLYEWTHYLSHAHYVPKGAYYRRIWKNHRLHHFKNEQNWFAFTVPLIDTVLGTDPAPDEVQTSDTVRTLGVDE